MAPKFPKPPRAITARKLKLAARILFEADEGRTDSALSRAHSVSVRTIKRWRQREAAGELPVVTAELKRLKAATADIVKARAEQVLERVYDFLEKATNGDAKDPRMVEAMVRAGEFLAENIAMAGMLNVPRTRTPTQDRATGQPNPRVAGGTVPDLGDSRPVH